MDAITRISYYFPTHTLTTFQILSNLVINNSSSCREQEQSLIIAMLVLFSIACFMVSFTDTYTALNGQKFWVIMMPFYGPLCFSLPCEEDKDRVYDFFYLKIRDYVHAVLATTAFVLIALFTNPICMCLFPSGADDGTARFDASIIRTVPIVVALLTSMIMICLGPPRQMLGFQNVPDTSPLPERPMNSNPMYAGSQQADYPLPPPTIPEGDEGDYEAGPHKDQGQGYHAKGSMARNGPGPTPGRDSYQSQSEYRGGGGPPSGRQGASARHNNNNNSNYAGGQSGGGAGPPPSRGGGGSGGAGDFGFGNGGPVEGYNGGGGGAGVGSAGAGNNGYPREP